MQTGGLAGYPVLGLKATLVDGAFHAKDSSGMAFEVASREAFKIGFEKARPVLLEPMMRVTVTTSGDCLGAVIGDLLGRRGKVLVSDRKGTAHEITANVPLANMFNYVNTVRSLSQGRANFTMQLDHCAPMPEAPQAKVIAAA
jgi:elongation factor G